MLENWLRPVNANLVDALALDKERFGSKIQCYTDLLPRLMETQIALVGMGEEEANAVRRALYKLSFPFGKLRIADLGNVRKEEPAFVIPLIRELLDGKICPIFIGCDHRFAQAQFEAHHSWQQAVSLAVVDERIAFHPKHSELAGNWLNPIFQHKTRLFHFGVIGCQSHFVDESVFRYLEKRNFDCIRLGKAKANLADLEPLVRDADLLCFHLAALKQAEAPGVAEASPNGFLSEEACQISRYAGMSDKLTSIGFYGFDHTLDKNNQTAQTLAQLIWYFLDGFYHRKHDFPASMDDLVEYIVELKDHDYQLTFWKSNKTGRWWLQVPVKTKKKLERHRLIPCSYNDYLLASDGELPDRLFSAIKRFG